VAAGVDPTSDRPVYKQIADALRSRIESGSLSPGEKLPSESALTQQFKVSQGTVRQALGILRGEGLIVAEHGRGVFVRSRPKIRRLAHDRFARRHRERGKAAYLVEAEKDNSEPRVDVIYVGPEAVPAELASHLSTEPETQVLARRRCYLSDGQPTELATSYIPYDIASGTAITEQNPGPGGIYARIEEAGHRLDKFTEDVSARMPTPEEVKALRLAPGTPVITLLRVAYDSTGRAVEICDTVMSADHYVLSYELPAT
jgi:GntR family transcriptional regulator